MIAIIIIIIISITIIIVPQVHDCLIIILGCLSGIEENLVFAFATKGWHMYFGTGMSALRWAV